MARTICSACRSGLFVCLVGCCVTELRTASCFVIVMSVVDSVVYMPVLVQGNWGKSMRSVTLHPSTAAIYPS